jgi:hypothetical protein
MTGCDGGEHGRAGFGAKGLRLIIVVVQLGVAVKIYVVAVEALKKKERQGWNSVYHQNWLMVFWVSSPVEC